MKLKVLFSGLNPVNSGRTGRSALLIIAFLFGASAIARLGAGSGQAIAKGIAELSDANEAVEDTSQCIPVGSIGSLVATLNERENRIVTKERELEDLAQTLKLAKDQFKFNMAALVQAEDSLAAMISRSSTAAEDDLARLTTVYENMKPAEAANLFGEMNPTFAAGFIGRMRPDSAAQILAGLPPKTAYTISVILAGRNANVPTE